MKRTALGAIFSAWGLFAWREIMDAETKVELDKLAQSILSLEERVTAELRKPYPINERVEKLEAELASAKKDYQEFRDSLKKPAPAPEPATTTKLKRAQTSLEYALGIDPDDE